MNGMENPRLITQRESDLPGPTDPIADWAL
jgi:hypothetical protein